MDFIKQYLLSILAAAIICAIITKLTRHHQAISGIIKMITTIFLSVTVFTPLLNLKVCNQFALPDQLSLKADEIISSAQTDIKNQTEEIIISQTETYILEKAALYDADINVSIGLDSDTGVPASVTLRGMVAPATKQRIQHFLVEEVGIPEEDQVWIISTK